MLSRFLKGSTRERDVATLYARIVEQARQPAFFADLGVPDSIEGRFEVIALHGWMVMRRLGADPAAGAFNQALFDHMFADLDLNLRELGVGDLGVSKKIKNLAEHFYGRVRAYEAGLAPEAGEGALAEAIDRNLYGSTLPDAAHVGVVARYVSAAVAALEGQDAAAIMKGRIAFPVLTPAGEIAP